MLDGLKMEENFQSAIETSASFSSLLGECSGRARRAHRLSARPRLWRPARWDTAVGELAPRFAHSVELTPCQNLWVLPTLNRPAAPGLSGRAPYSLERRGAGELARGRLTGK